MMPMARQNICGMTWARLERWRSHSASCSRHHWGWTWFWPHRKVTGTPVLAEISFIQASSMGGATRSSPSRPAGAISSTPRPLSPTARARASISSRAAKVPGTGSPSMARWTTVREEEKPSDPQACASVTSRAISAMSSGVAGSFMAPRSPMT